MTPIDPTYFEMFGLEPRFGIDLAPLAEVYQRLAAAVHPDLHLEAPESQQRLALQRAAQINDAWTTLRDPARRATYLCQWHGVDPGLQDNTAMPVSFLMQQMEWREGLEERLGARDEDGIDSLLSEVGDHRRDLIAQLGQAFDIEHDVSHARDLLRQLMFVDRFAEEADRAAQSLWD
jgi:molecular chaperone HscB